MSRVLFTASVFAMSTLAFSAAPVEERSVVPEKKPGYCKFFYCPEKKTKKSDLDQPPQVDLQKDADQPEPQGFVAPVEDRAKDGLKTGPDLEEVASVPVEDFPIVIPEEVLVDADSASAIEPENDLPIIGSYEEAAQEVLPELQPKSEPEVEVPESNLADQTQSDQEIESSVVQAEVDVDDLQLSGSTAQAVSRDASEVSIDLGTTEPVFVEETAVDVISEELVEDVESTPLIEQENDLPIADNFDEIAQEVISVKQSEINDYELNLADQGQSDQELIDPSIVQTETEVEDLQLPSSTVEVGLQDIPEDGLDIEASVFESVEEAAVIVSEELVVDVEAESVNEQDIGLPVAVNSDEAAQEKLPESQSESEIETPDLNLAEQSHNNQGFDELVETTDTSEFNIYSTEDSDTLEQAAETLVKVEDSLETKQPLLGDVIEVKNDINQQAPDTQQLINKKSELVEVNSEPVIASEQFQEVETEMPYRVAPANTFDTNTTYLPDANINVSNLALPESGPSSSQEPLNDSYDSLQLLRQEVMELRGLIDELSYELKRLKLRQSDDYLDLDRRIASAMASNSGAEQPATLTPPPIIAPAVVAPEKSEVDEYSAAYSLLKAGDISGARQALIQHTVAFPKGDYTANAYYWLGEIYLIEGEHTSAIESFEKVVNDHPAHRKAADALFKLGTAYHLSGNPTKALEILTKASEGDGSSATLAAKYLKDNY